MKDNIHNILMTEFDHNGILRLTLNDPDNKNALSELMIQKLIKAHAEYEKENECCGLIGLNNLKEIQVVPCENTHITREKNFEISPKSFVEKSKGLEILSIYHSHTISGPQPSEFDKLSARNWQLPFYIYSIKTKT